MPSFFRREGVATYLFLFAQGTIAALAGTFFAAWLFPREASLVLIFLATISCMGSTESLLDRNRVQIQEQGMRPGRANALLTVSILCLFLGALVSFSALGLTLPLEQVEDLFGHQIAGRAGQSFSTATFGTAPALLAHNLYVLLFFLLIAIPFRHGGVMLAIAWNASVWGATFGMLARRWSEQGGPHLGAAWWIVMASLSPHMLAEAVAYTLAGLGGVFLSKAVMKYSLDSAILGRILRSVGSMLAVAAILVVAGALWEAWLTPFAVGFFRR